MGFNLVFLERFEKELFEAIDWYANTSIRNSEKLVEDVNLTLDALSKNPFVYQKLNKKRRKLNLKIYPYKIVYELGDDAIIIVALVHHKRHPRYWRRTK